MPRGTLRQSCWRPTPTSSVDACGTPWRQPTLSASVRCLSFWLTALLSRTALWRSVTCSPRAQTGNASRFVDCVQTIWKRFWRLSQAGVFEAFFDALAATSRTAHLVQMLDSTVVRAHVSAAGAKGGQDGQALGRSRGGFSTKIHLKADLDGLPLAFHLTEGQASDSPQFEILLDLGPDITPRAAVGDKGYDSTGNRTAARERGICPVIPFKSSARNRPAFFPKALYRARARIEQLVGKLKRFKPVALRCEKTNKNFGSFVAFALGLIIVKSVHTA